jgi:transposase InsO family protein
VSLHAPGEQERNAFIESFNGHLCIEFPNETPFSSLVPTRTLLAQSELDHNTILPHSSLGNLPRAHYEKPQRFGIATGRVIAHNQRLGAPARCNIAPDNLK